MPPTPTDGRCRAHCRPAATTPHPLEQRSHGPGASGRVVLRCPRGPARRRADPQATTSGPRQSRRQVSLTSLRAHPETGPVRDPSKVRRSCRRPEGRTITVRGSLPRRGRGGSPPHVAMLSVGHRRDASAGRSVLRTGTRAPLASPGLVMERLRSRSTRIGLRSTSAFRAQLLTRGMDAGGRPLRPPRDAGQ